MKGTDPAGAACLALLAALALPQAASEGGSESGWSIETVASGRPLGFPMGDMAVGPDGEVHLSIPVQMGGGPGVYYASDRGDDWALELVAGHTYNSWGSIALDPEGSPLIAISSDGWNEFTLARRSAGGWVLEKVPVPEGAAEHSPSAAAVESSLKVLEISIAIDAWGVVHLAYPMITGDAGYAVKRDGSWRVELVRGCYFHNDVGIALDRSGAPVLLCVDYPEDGGPWRQFIATRVADGWARRYVGVQGWLTSLHFLPDGRAAGPVYDWHTGKLALLREAGSEWVETPVEEGWRGSSASAAVDREGGFHLSYSDWDRAGLTYAHELDGVIDSGPVMAEADNRSRAGYGNRIALSASGEAVILFGRFTDPENRTGDIMLARGVAGIPPPEVPVPARAKGQFVQGVAVAAILLPTMALAALITLARPKRKPRASSPESA